MNAKKIPGLLSPMVNTNIHNAFSAISPNSPNSAHSSQNPKSLQTHSKAPLRSPQGKQQQWGANLSPVDAWQPNNLDLAEIAFGPSSPLCNLTRPKSRTHIAQIERSARSRDNSAPNADQKSQT